MGVRNSQPKSGVGTYKKPTEPTQNSTKSRDLQNGGGHLITRRWVVARDSTVVIDFNPMQSTHAQE